MWGANPSITRIVWAVDAFEESTPLLENAIHTVEALRERFPKADIQPVYVFTPGGFNLSSELAAPFAAPWLEELRPAAGEALTSLIAAMPPRFKLLAPLILRQGFSSTYGAVSSLIRFSFRWNADLILTSTRASHGLKRWLLGSFAEGLSKRSPIPVLIVGPETRPLGSFERVLFPTELGRVSYLVFRECVRLARDLGSRVILYHNVKHVFEPAFLAGAYLRGNHWVSAASIYTSDLNLHQRHIRHWMTYARNKNVGCESLNEIEPESAVESILRVASRLKPSLIVLEPQLPSFLHRVLRQSPCPVLVMSHHYVTQLGATAQTQRAAKLRAERKAA